jgi:hypothetical protein
MPAGRRATRGSAIPQTHRRSRKSSPSCAPPATQRGHTNLGITSIYLQGIDNAEIIDTVHARRAPMIPVHSSLRV